jgi:sugar/nucleoside kinase (ribokinase family)
MSLLVLGTVALDTVKTPFGKREQMLGGSAVHFSMSGRLFTDIHLAAVIGEDFPQKHIEFLRRKGINTDSVRRVAGKTFEWCGEYEGDLNAAVTLNTELGVLLSFKPQVSAAQSRIENIFLANIDPDLQEHLLAQMRKPRLVALDSMNYWIQHKRESLLKLLKKVDIYVANDQEARSLSDEVNLIKAAKRLGQYGPKMVLVKKGEHGVIFYDGDSVFALTAYPVEKVIDPTGAGDTFAGGFMGYLSAAKKINSATLKKALAFGTVAASFNVEGFGVEATQNLKLKDLEKRLAIFRKVTSF